MEPNWFVTDGRHAHGQGRCNYTILVHLTVVIILRFFVLVLPAGSLLGTTITTNARVAVIFYRPFFWLFAHPTPTPKVPSSLFIMVIIQPGKGWWSAFSGEESFWMWKYGRLKGMFALKLAFFPERVSKKSEVNENMLLVLLTKVIYHQGWRWNK